MSKENPSLIHDHDLHWKLITEALYKDFIAYFLPELYPKVDFGKAPVSIEKEFHRLVFKKETRKGKAFNDKLFNTPMLEGPNRIILVHTEFQSDGRGDLPSRMFRYFYLIREKFEHDITAIAIYTGKNVPTPKDRYEYRCEGVELIYKFNTFDVMENREEHLLVDPNPFALVVLACQYLNETMNDAERRVVLKLKLIELAFERGYNQKQVNALLTFIEFMLILPDEQELEYIEESRKIYQNIAVMPATEARKQWADYIYQLVHGSSVQDLIQVERDARRQEEKARKREEEARKREEEARKREEIARKREEEARRQDKINTAANFLKIGVSPKDIALATGLPLDKVIALQKEHGL